MRLGGGSCQPGDPRLCCPANSSCVATPPEVWVGSPNSWVTTCLRTRHRTLVMWARGSSAQVTPYKLATALCLHICVSPVLVALRCFASSSVRWARPDNCQAVGHYTGEPMARQGGGVVLGIAPSSTPPRCPTIRQDGGVILGITPPSTPP